MADNLPVADNGGAPRVRIRMARTLLLVAATLGLLAATTIAIVLATAGPTVVVPVPGEPIDLGNPEQVTGQVDPAREAAPSSAGSTHEPGHVLTVRVVGEEAEPLPGASVSLVRDSIREQIGSFETGSKGEVVVRLPHAEDAGPIHLDVAAPGRVAASEWVSVPDVCEVTVRMRRAAGAASIRGLLEYPGGGIGLGDPGPNVYVWRHGTRPPTSAFWRRQGPSGRSSCSRLPPTGPSSSRACTPMSCTTSLPAVVDGAPAPP